MIAVVGFHITGNRSLSILDIKPDYVSAPMPTPTNPSSILTSRPRERLASSKLVRWFRSHKEILLFWHLSNLTTQNTTRNLFSTSSIGWGRLLLTLVALFGEIRSALRSVLKRFGKIAAYYVGPGRNIPDQILV